MATESTIIIPSSLLEELAERTRLSWPQVAIMVGLVLILFLVGAAYLDGVVAGPFNAEFWQNGMLYPALITYMLLLYPILRRLSERAIEAFRPLLLINDDDFNGLLAEMPLFNRRRQWLALGIGVVGGLLLWRPWDYYGPTGAWLSSGGRSGGWVPLYQVVALGLMYGLLGYFIHASLFSTRLFTELHRQPLEINIFDRRPLEPIARWSLGIVLSYIGGITLSLLFIPQRLSIIQNIIMYSTFILVSALMFFLNMMSTHRAIAEAKNRELNMVRDNLAAASQALKERATKGQVEDTETLSDSIRAWVTYEKRVKEVPEWPYTADIRRNLVLSILLPLAAFMVKGVLLELLLRLLSLL